MTNLIGQQIGQYQITALVGEGGMATVYRARQASVNRDVAIKVIKVNLAQSADFAKRFEREAQTVANLSHPHILKVFDYGQQQGLLYLVMELLSGGSLAAALKRGALPPDRVLRILEQISGALDYAHGQNIIHRDLKPQNVLLDAMHNVFLTDFGIAKIVTDVTSVTMTGQMMGTPAYMAPEQWRGETPAPTLDIYALGIMLHEMLTGDLPFKADTPFAMMYAHSSTPPPSLSTARPDLSPAIDAVLQRALAKEPANRFQSAGDLALAFRDALEGRTTPFISTQTPTDKALPRQSGLGADQTLPPQPVPQPSSRLPLLIGGALIILLLAGVLFLLLTNPANTPSIAQVSGTPSQVLVPTTALPTNTDPPPTATLEAVAPTLFAATQLAQAPSPTLTATNSPTALPTIAPTNTPSATASPTATLTSTHTPTTDLRAIVAQTAAAIATQTAIIIEQTAQAVQLETLVAEQVLAFAQTSTSFIPHPLSIT